VELAKLAGSSGEVGEILLEATTGKGVLLVMGAYGHWRWREWVFGGATPVTCCATRLCPC
jgi:nucleotide-binding universal stress UspA family protein